MRTSLLLQFMEYLERHLYNAVEGCAVTMAPLPKVFFVVILLCLNLVSSSNENRTVTDTRLSFFFHGWSADRALCIVIVQIFR